MRQHLTTLRFSLVQLYARFRSKTKQLALSFEKEHIFKQLYGKVSRLQ